MRIGMTLTVLVIGLVGLWIQLLASHCPNFTLHIYWLIISVYVLTFIVLLLARKVVNKHFILWTCITLALTASVLNGGFASNLCLVQFGAMNMQVHLRFHVIRNAVQLHIFQSRTLPFDPARFLEAMDSRTDPWGGTIQIESERNSLHPNCIQYALRCFGPDGVPQNSDDLVYVFACSANAECASSCPNIK